MARAESEIQIGSPDDDAVGVKGAFGPPVNCRTMVQKFVVSVLMHITQLGALEQ